MTWTNNHALATRQVQTSLFLRVTTPALLIRGVETQPLERVIALFNGSAVSQIKSV